MQRYNCCKRKQQTMESVRAAEASKKKILQFKMPLRPIREKGSQTLLKL
jgi:hypothetical protein